MSRKVMIDQIRPKIKTERSGSLCHSQQHQPTKEFILDVRTNIFVRRTQMLAISARQQRVDRVDILKNNENWIRHHYPNQRHVTIIHSIHVCFEQQWNNIDTMLYLFSQLLLTIRHRQTKRHTGIYLTPPHTHTHTVSEYDTKTA